METKYHFYIRLQSFIKHGFNFLLKSGVERTDYMVNERIKKIYFKMLFDSFCCRVCCMSLFRRPDVHSFVTVISFSATLDITPFRINNGKIHSASEAMSKCLLAGFT